MVAFIVGSPCALLGHFRVFHVVMARDSNMKFLNITSGRKFGRQKPNRAYHYEGSHTSLLYRLLRRNELEECICSKIFDGERVLRGDDVTLLKGPYERRIPRGPYSVAMMKLIYRLYAHVYHIQFRQKTRLGLLRI